MTNFQAKHHIGKALAESLEIEVQLTPTWLLSAETQRKLNEAGFYWFGSRRCWCTLENYPNQNTSDTELTQ